MGSNVTGEKALKYKRQVRNRKEIFPFLYGTSHDNVLQDKKNNGGDCTTTTTHIPRQINTMSSRTADLCQSHSLPGDLSSFEKPKEQSRVKRDSLLRFSFHTDTEADTENCDKSDAFTLLSPSGPSTIVDDELPCSHATTTSKANAWSNKYHLPLIQPRESTSLSEGCEGCREKKNLSIQAE
jgi:hypothetical protein